MWPKNIPEASAEGQIIGEKEDQGWPGPQREADKREEPLPLPPNSEVAL